MRSVFFLEHVIIYEVVLSCLNVGEKQPNKQKTVSDKGHAISLVLSYAYTIQLGIVKKVTTNTNKTKPKMNKREGRRKQNERLDQTHSKVIRFFSQWKPVVISQCSGQVVLEYTHFYPSNCSVLNQ